jgi:hypothetical protein
MHKNAQECVWGSPPPLSGKNPTPPGSVIDLFFPSAYRIWKQGGVSVITGGAIQSTSSSLFFPGIGFFFNTRKGQSPAQLCHRSFFAEFLQRLTEFGTGWCVCYNRGAIQSQLFVPNQIVSSIFFWRNIFNGLPNLETGWCVCYNRGGRSSQLRHRCPNQIVSSIFFGGISSTVYRIRNRVVCLL